MPNSSGTTTEPMIVTGTLDVPREIAWEAWTNPTYVQQWWGPDGFTTPTCQIDLRVGGKFLICMRTPDGQDLWSGGDYHEIVPHEKIALSMYFADAQGNRVSPEHYGIEHQGQEDVHDLVTFEALPNNRTKLTFRGNESMEDAEASGQIEGWRQMFAKFAAVASTLPRTTS